VTGVCHKTRDFNVKNKDASRKPIAEIVGRERLFLAMEIKKKTRNLNDIYASVGGWGYNANISKGLVCKHNTDQFFVGGNLRKNLLKGGGSISTQKKARKKKKKRRKKSRGIQVHRAQVNLVRGVKSENNQGEMRCLVLEGGFPVTRKAERKEGDFPGGLQQKESHTIFK